MNKRILVTGGAGFIGSHLTNHLLKMGNKITIIDNFSTGNRDKVPNGVKIIEGDITCIDDCLNACNNVDIIVHLAASVSIRNSSKIFNYDANVNINGTLNLLEASSNSNVERFIFSSSMGVYSDSNETKRNTEMSRTEPISPYGISKLAGERYVLLLGEKFGIEPVILRLFNTFGTNQSYTPYVGVITIFITNLLNDKKCKIYGSGDQCRDFIHVSDVVKGITLAIESSGAAGKIFNIGTGSGLTVNEIYQMLYNRIGRGSFVKLSSTGTELQYSVADISKAKNELGFKPQYSLENKIDEVISYIKQNNNLVQE